MVNARPTAPETDPASQNRVRSGEQGDMAAVNAPVIKLTRILVVTDNNVAASHISDHLRPLNYDAHQSFFDGKTLRGTPKTAPDIILFALTDYVEHAPNLHRALKKHFNGRDLPTIAALSRKSSIDTSIFDSVIYPPAHPSQIATRVDSMVRLRSMEREIMRRIDTLSADFDVRYTLSDDALSKPFRVLFIGKATPEFMVIINALQEKNVDVVAAFTTFTAFDYLHDRHFDAVVMNALIDTEPAMTISQTMRRNSKLYHVPTLFLITDDFTQHAQAFQSGARDVINAASPTDEISGRILELANYHRIHDQLKQEFSEVGGPLCIEGESGTFNEPFFYAHLKRVCRDVKTSNSTLALMAVKIAAKASYPVSDAAFSRACGNVGAMIKNLVRMQDIVARIDDDIYLIAFPDETVDTIAAVNKRIDGIVDCAAFNSDKTDEPPFTVTIDAVTVELLEHENSDMFIGKALSDLHATIAQLPAG